MIAEIAEAAFQHSTGGAREVFSRPVLILIYRQPRRCFTEARCMRDGRFITLPLSRPRSPAA